MVGEGAEKDVIRIRGTLVVVGENMSDFQDKLSLYISKILGKAIRERGNAKIAVSGGSMPALVAPLLVTLRDINWSKIRIFVADERMVPVDDAYSNTGSYMCRLPEYISNSLIHYGPIDSTAECARNYEKQMRDCNMDMEEGWPVFDLLLLGVGPDGHTCSLFPGHPLLKESSKWVAAIEDSPKAPPRRITLTLPVINHSRNVAFICLDGKKGVLINKIINGQDLYLPAAMVRPKSGTVTWFMDKETFADVTVNE